MSFRLIYNDVQYNMQVVAIISGLTCHLQAKLPSRVQCSVHVQCWRFLWPVFCACAVLAGVVACVLLFFTYRVTLLFLSPL